MGFYESTYRAFTTDQVQVPSINAVASIRIRVMTHVYWPELTFLGNYHELSLFNYN